MIDAIEHTEPNDPRASMRHLQEQARDRNRAIEMYKNEGCKLKRQLAACRAELLMRSESVAVAEELRVKVTLELAACRAELSRFRAGVCVCAVKTVSQAEAERDKLRDACETTAAALRNCELCDERSMGRDITDETVFDYAPQYELKSTLLASLEAALFPTPENSDGAGGEVKA